MNERPAEPLLRAQGDNMVETKVVFIRFIELCEKSYNLWFWCLEVIVGNHEIFAIYMSHDLKQVLNRSYDDAHGMCNGSYNDAHRKCGLAFSGHSSERYLTKYWEVGRQRHSHMVTKIPRNVRSSCTHVRIIRLNVHSDRSDSINWTYTVIDPTRSTRIPWLSLHQTQINK